MTKKYKITLDRNACIGVFACVEADGKLWLKSDDGKVDLANGKEVSPGIWEVILEEGQFSMDSEKVCPVVAIKIEEVKE